MGYGLDVHAHDPIEPHSIRRLEIVARLRDDITKKDSPLRLSELVEKAVKRDYRGYEGAGYPLPVALVCRKFD